MWNQQLLVLRIVISVHTRISERMDIVAVYHLESLDFKLFSYEVMQYFASGNTDSVH